MNCFKKTEGYVQRDCKCLELGWSLRKLIKMMEQTVWIFGSSPQLLSWVLGAMRFLSKSQRNEAVAAQILALEKKKTLEMCIKNSRILFQHNRKASEKKHKQIKDGTHYNLRLKSVRLPLVECINKSGVAYCIILSFNNHEKCKKHIGNQKHLTIPFVYIVKTWLSSV